MLNLDLFRKGCPLEFHRILIRGNPEISIGFYKICTYFAKGVTLTIPLDFNGCTTIFQEVPLRIALDSKGLAPI